MLVAFRRMQVGSGLIRFVFRNPTAELFCAAQESRHAQVVPRGTTAYRHQCFTWNTHDLYCST